MIAITVQFLFIVPIVTYAQVKPDSVMVSKPNRDTCKQRDLIDVAAKLLKINLTEQEDTTDHKFNFNLLPLSTEVPGGGKALVTSVTASFYLGKRNNTRLSEIWFVPYIDFDGRYGLPIRSYLWLKENKWILRGDMRIMQNPEYTWGLPKEGIYPDTGILINKSFYRMYQNLLKEVHKNLFLGLGYNLDIHSQIKSATPGQSLNGYTGYPYGTAEGTTTVSSGLNLNLLYDTRSNSTNPDGGTYFDVEYRTNPVFLGSDSWWHSLYIDGRKYINFNRDKEKKNMLALWSYYWTAFGSNPPYFDLPAIGGETFNTSGRGFQIGQIRAKSIFYLEAEYRRDITRDGLLGFTVFSNINSAGSFNRELFRKWEVAAGLGLRIKLDKSSATNISIDYAISKHYSGVYLTIGEFF